MTQHFVQIGPQMLACTVNVTMWEKPSTELIADLPNTGQRKEDERKREQHSIAHAKLVRLLRLYLMHITLQVNIQISTESNQEPYLRRIGLSQGILSTVEKMNLKKRN